MKTLLLVLQLLFTVNIYAQDFTQNEFDKINNDVSRAVYSLAQPLNAAKFSEKFNIADTDFQILEQLNAGEKLTFNDLISENHILPIFFPADKPDELQLTLFAFKALPKRTNEDFNRANYYFVLTTIITLKDGNPFYSNTKLIYESKSIIDWFLSGYRSYLEKTDPVFRKYKFIPPPPPPPPNDLK